ncbi:MAG: hypothetical protein ACK5US_04655, partial [Lysobacteraceae bacterium]
MFEVLGSGVAEVIDPVLVNTWPLPGTPVAVVAVNTMLSVVPTGTLARVQSSWLLPAPENAQAQLGLEVM